MENSALFAFERVQAEFEGEAENAGFDTEESMQEYMCEIRKREREEEMIDMSEFFNEMERNKVIDTARKMYEKKHNDEYAISFIECGLDVSEEEARTIFETEILGSVMA